MEDRKWRKPSRGGKLAKERLLLEGDIIEESIEIEIAVLQA